MDHTTREDWWNELQPGDKVILEYRGYNEWTRICRVERMPASQIIIAGPHNPKSLYRFRRTDGRELGGNGYNRTYLKRWTPEAEEAIAQTTAQDALFTRLKNTARKDLDGLTAAQCAHLQALLSNAGVPEKS
jgi:hypothetical protein